MYLELSLHLSNKVNNTNLEYNFIKELKKLRMKLLNNFILRFEKVSKIKRLMCVYILSNVVKIYFITLLVWKLICKKILRISTASLPKLFNPLYQILLENWKTIQGAPTSVMCKYCQCVNIEKLRKSAKSFSICCMYILNNFRLLHFI